MHDKVLSSLLEHKGKRTGRKSAELDRLDFGLSSYTILEKIHLASDPSLPRFCRRMPSDSKIEIIEFSVGEDRKGPACG